MKNKSNFSASRISELLAVGTGKTAQSYILDLALQEIDLKQDFDTKEMKHGRVCQVDCYQFVIEANYQNTKWHDDFMPINEYCGASPDFFIEGNTGDVKCPYTIDNFITQIYNPPKKYLLQIQMQMIAAKCNMGYLCFYLSKPEIWGEDKWEEYPFSLEKRYKIIEIKKDTEIQDLILKKVEEAHPLKIQLVSLLLGATNIELEQFYYEQFEGLAYKPLKEATSFYNLNEIFRVKDKFYYKK
jgi:hypothetical protein